MFLDKAPPLDTLAGVRGRKDEQIGLGTREIYIHYGDGMAKSKLVCARRQSRNGAQHQYGRGAGRKWLPIYNRYAGSFSMCASWRTRNACSNCG